MAESSRDDRLLDLARRLLSGEAIDWDKEGIAESEVREGMKRLEQIVGHADRAAETETARSPPRDRSDRFIGDFRIARKLGEGGMGVAYEAEQQYPKRPVALKVIHGGAHVSPDTLKLFRREIQTLARLNDSFGRSNLCAVVTGKRPGGSAFRNARNGGGGNRTRVQGLEKRAMALHAGLTAPPQRS
jgi:hypothetical protein